MLNYLFFMIYKNVSSCKIEENITLYYVNNIAMKGANYEEYSTSI